MNVNLFGYQSVNLRSPTAHSIMPGVIRFEKASSKELVNKKFKLGDGAITITRADDLGVPYPERTVWFWRDKPDPPDSGDGHCLLTFLERLVEIRDDSRS